MNLYLIRHGAAEDKKPGGRDFDRMLTDEGIQKMKTAANGWKNLITHFDYLVSSPYPRAVQTAEIVKDVYSHKDKILFDKRFGPGCPSELLTDIANELNAENIAFFGHEPDFSGYVSDLISNSGARIDFKKGAIAKISFFNKAKLGVGTLEFLIPARTF